MLLRRQGRSRSDASSGELSDSPAARERIAASGLLRLLAHAELAQVPQNVWYPLSPDGGVSA